MSVPVKYYYRDSAVLCCANANSKRTNEACLGIIGSGASEKDAYTSFFNQVKERIDILQTMAKEGT